MMNDSVMECKVLRCDAFLGGTSSKTRIYLMTNIVITVIVWNFSWSHTHLRGGSCVYNEIGVALDGLWRGRVMFVALGCFFIFFIFFGIQL